MILTVEYEGGKFLYFCEVTSVQVTEDIFIYFVGTSGGPHEVKNYKVISLYDGARLLYEKRAA